MNTQNHPKEDFFYALCLLHPKGNRDIYKVGKTGSTVDSRLKSLQTGSDEVLTLRATIRCNSIHTAHQIEKQIHYAFGKQRLQGEWFHISQADMEGVLNAYAIQQYTTEHHNTTTGRAARFVVGANGHAKDKEGEVVRRALTRVATLERANRDLAFRRREQIDDMVAKLEARNREITQLKAQLKALSNKPRPSWWQRLTQMFQQKART